MATELHTRLRELFIAACDLPEEARNALLDEQCAGDHALRAEIERLLEKDGCEQGILGDGELAAGIHVPVNNIADQAVPEWIGGYRVKKVLGIGGMGVVYLAEQENPKRDVALKVIRGGFMSRELRRRFELEAAVLGRLQHPGIAQVYEAGMFDDGSGGRPFFAMEHVDGQPLNSFVREHASNVHDILRLIIDICDAVNHAHQRGIIHRDLKPGNILVTREGQPKILDFGVARAMDSDLQISTLKTDVGQLIGTLPYMSPEQIGGRGNEVDTRSDVYALGVILYQLLADRLPYELADQSIVSAGRVILEKEPEPLSTINRVYRGDLNTIVLKALEKDPDRRYQSASDFASDLRRYLSDQPIVARPATTAYQFRKFAKRNKALVAGVVATIVALLGGVIGTTIGMLGAQRESQRTSAMNDFMTDILVSADPSFGRADVRLIDVVRDASEDVSLRFQGHPLLEADVSLLLGRTLKRLTYNEEAIEHHRRAYELRRTQLGAAAPQTRSAGAHLVFALLSRDAEACIELAEELLLTLPGSDQNGAEALGLRRYIAAAHARLRNYDVAERGLREVLASARESLDADDTLVIQTSSSLAGLLKNRAHLHGGEDAGEEIAEAETLYRDAIERGTRVYGPDGGETLRLMLNLGDVLRRAEKNDEAGALAMKVLELAPARYGEDHNLCTRAMVDLSFIRYAQGRFGEAAKHRIRAIELTRRRTGDADIEVVVLFADGLPILDAAGEWAKAMEYAEILHERFGKSAGHGSFGHEYRIWPPYLQARLGNEKDAAPLLDELLLIEDDMDELRRTQLHYARGACFRAQGDREAARRHFEIALELCGDQSRAWPRLEFIVAAIDDLDSE